MQSLPKTFSFLTISIYLLIPPYSASASNLNCTSTPDCIELGYTMTADECLEKPHVRCPTDFSKFFCSKDNIECSVGSVLGSNKLCYDANKLPTNIYPIGVIFDEQNHLAVALNCVQKDGSTGHKMMPWSRGNVLIKNLDVCLFTDDLKKCGSNGRYNTDTILADKSTTYAAEAANAYEPQYCSADFCKKNQWFLPSIKELISLYDVKTTIDNTMTLLSSFGAETIDREFYWSSTQFSDAKAWGFHMWHVSGNGFYNASYKTDDRPGYGMYVRPILSYETP